LLETRTRATFTRRPGGAQPSGPIRLGRLEPPVVEALARRLRRCGQMRRRPQRLPRRPTRTQAAPERREHLGRFVRWLDQQIGVMGFDRDTAFPERRRHAVIRRNALRLVAAVPMHSARADLDGERRHHVRRRPAAQHKATTSLLQLLIKRAQ
jgi:hypothetical protein